MILLSDIFSMFHGKNGPIKLGQGGENVKLVADHGNVLVVEGKKGRFTVTKSQISEQCRPDLTSLAAAR